MSSRLRRIVLAPVGTEPVELLLAAMMVARGLAVLAFDGITPANAPLVLRLAPAWAWGVLPLTVGAAMFAAVLRGCHPTRRWAAWACLMWNVVWIALVAVGDPRWTLVPFLVVYAVCALAAAWAWMALGLSDGTRG